MKRGAEMRAEICAEACTEAIPVEPERWRVWPGDCYPKTNHAIVRATRSPLGLGRGVGEGGCFG